MKILTLILRLIVSFTFIFSGFVKLVDPLGSSYKFQEYFSAGVLNLEFLIPYA
ncbi:MAG: DoxX family protein, partial [Lutibacter sp.]|nr:DoxX family protein [Lutibacter sp.]